MGITDEPHIGTLNEGGLHRGLKAHLARPGDRFEVALDGFVIDIMRGDLLIEIQTGSLGALGRKLDCLLDHHRIRIVRPFAATRWLERPGRRRRRSPKRHDVWSIFDELVSIPTLLEHPHLELQVVLTEESELRSEPRRRGRARSKGTVERRLERVVAELPLREPADLLQVIPSDLPPVFTTSDFARASELGRDRAQRICYVLRHAGLIQALRRTRAGVEYTR